MDLTALRHQVAGGNFALRSHTMQHAVKEGFTKEDITYIVLNGRVIEDYPDRKRCLLYDTITIEGYAMPLHVICEHSAPEAVVDVVTAYIPAEDEWITPTRRRKKRGR